MEKFFKLKQNNTTPKTEILAGITSFLATMYIIVVNPAILQKTGMPFSAVLTATVLVSAFTSIMMGIYAKNPIVLAPGMGLNAFFTFTVVLGLGVSWEKALGAVFWSGIVFLLLSVFNIRTLIVHAIPRQIRYGVAAGIGLFITLIGFRNANFIVPSEATLVTRGPLDPIAITFLLGLLLTSVLIIKRFRGALILGIIGTTLLALGIGRFWGEAGKTIVNWQGLFAAPDFSLFFAIDLLGSLQLAILPIVFTFVFTDMFDSISTFLGLAEAAELTDEKGDPLNIKKSLIVDAVGTTISGIFGTSAATSYIESAAGIREGGRTGLVAVTAGLLFLPFMFFSPLLSVIPAIATAPALVLVGAFMMKPVLKIRWDEFDNSIPAYLSLVLIPLTYSITQGIIWGFLSWIFIKFICGKHEEISPTLMIMGLFALVALLIG